MLSDDEKRKRYDRYGHVGTDEAFRGSEANFEEVFKDIGFGGFRDIFEQFFGGGGGGFSSTGRGDPFGFGFNFGGRTRKGQDILYDLDVSLEEVVKGTREEIEVPVVETCHVCKGTGARPRDQNQKMWNMRWPRPNQKSIQRKQIFNICHPRNMQSV